MFFTSAHLSVKIHVNRSRTRAVKRIEKGLHKSLDVRSSMQAIIQHRAKKVLGGFEKMLQCRMVTKHKYKCFIFLNPINQLAFKTASVLLGTLAHSF